MGRNGLNPPDVSQRVLVVLCADLAQLEPGLDLDQVRRWFADTYPTAVVRVQPRLCQQPGDLGKLAASEGVARIVLGLCDTDYPEAEVQTQLRKAGLDPLGTEVIPLGVFCRGPDPASGATDKARILLAAAVAKVLAFPGSGPENSRPYIPAKVSRRALFRALPLAYRPVPVVEEDRCAAGAGCPLCVEACPYGALEPSGGRVTLEKVRCEGCGICVTACPTEATSLPGATSEALGAQLQTLLDPTVGNVWPRNIIYVCPRGRTPDWAARTSAWLPVILPCTAMAAPAWLLTPLIMGAAAVRVLACEGCRAAEIVRGRVDFCRQLLAMAQLAPDLVGVGPPAEGQVQPVETGGALAAADQVRLSHRPEVLADLVMRLSPEDLRLAHPWSPLGVVDVRPEVCTGCGMCARVCPTGALAFEQSDREVSLSFEPARCVGCGLCAGVCPEVNRGAIAVERAVDLGRLRQGRVTFYREPVVRCARCGAPIAPDRLVNRVLGLLGAEYSALFPVLTRYCNSCRGLVGPYARS